MRHLLLPCAALLAACSGPATPPRAVAPHESSPPSEFSPEVGDAPTASSDVGSSADASDGIAEAVTDSLEGAPVDAAASPLPDATGAEAELLEQLRARLREQRRAPIFPYGFAVTTDARGARALHLEYGYSRLASWRAELESRGRWQATVRRAQQLSRACAARRERNNARWSRRAEALRAASRDDDADEAESHVIYWDENGPDEMCDGWEQLFEHHATAGRCAPDGLVHVVHVLEPDGALGARLATHEDLTCRIDVDPQSGEELTSQPMEELPPRMPTVDFDGDGVLEVVSVRTLFEEHQGPDRFSHRAFPHATRVRVLAANGSERASRRIEAFDLRPLGRFVRAELNPYRDADETAPQPPSVVERWWLGVRAGRAALRYERLGFERWCQCSEIEQDSDWAARLSASASSPWRLERVSCDDHGPPVAHCRAVGEPSDSVFLEVPPP